MSNKQVYLQELKRSDQRYFEKRLKHHMSILLGKTEGIERMLKLGWAMELSTIDAMHDLKKRLKRIKHESDSI